MFVRMPVAIHCGCCWLHLPILPAPYLELPAASCNGDQVPVQQVVWLHAMALHGGVDVKRSLKVCVLVSHAGIDGGSVQLQEGQAWSSRQAAHRASRW